MALRIHSLPAGLEPWKGQTQSLPINKDEYGFCRVSCKPNVIIARCNIGIDGALSGPMKELSTKPWKTTVAFSLEEGTPALFKALSIFALRDIKVTKIESRPHRENPVRIVDGQNMGSFKYFEYVFIVDLEAPMGEGLVAVQRALDQLNQIASFVRILGGYPLNGY